MTDNLPRRSAQAQTPVLAKHLTSFVSILASALRRARNTEKSPAFAAAGVARFELENLENRVMLSVGNPTAPAIEALVASPYVATGPGSQGTGASFTLTAVNVEDGSNHVANVRFYEDSNDNGEFDVMDTMVGLGHQSGSDWSAEVTHEGFSSARYFAQASDDTGRNSNLVSTTVDFAPISIDKVSASVSSSKVKLTAVKVAGAASVEFYRDTNGNGVIDAGDEFLGLGKKVGHNWKLVAPAGNVNNASKSAKSLHSSAKSSPSSDTFMIRGVSADGNAGITKIVHGK